MLYAIFHKNMLSVGPLSYNQKYFTDVLRIRYKIITSLPLDPPLQLPLVIDENTYLYSVNEDRPEYNSMIQYLYGPQCEITNNQVIAKYTAMNLDMDIAKTNYKQLAATERYKKETSGLSAVIQNTTVFLDTQRTVRDQFLQKYVVINDDETILWKFDNIWLNLTKNDLRLISRTINQHVQNAFDWEANIVNQINATTDINALPNIPIL